MSNANTPGGKDYLTASLPQELLDQIVRNLDLGDQLKLRLVFNKDVFKNRVVEAIRPTLRILFVSPSRVSLKNFKRIAESPFFRDQVDTLIFVGSVTDGRDNVLDLEEEEYAAAAEDHSVMVEQYLLSSAATPVEMYRANARDCGISLTAQQAAYSFAIYKSWVADRKFVPPDLVLRTLTAGLLNLPKLKHLMIADVITKDGLNADASQYSCEYRVERGARGFVNLRDDIVQSAALDALRLRSRFLEQANDRLFEALDHANIQLESLTIGDSNLWLTNVVIQPDGIFSRAAFSNVISKLRRLTVNSDGLDQSSPKDCRVFWQHIATSATSLEELTLVASHGGENWELDGDASHVYRYFFDVGRYPSLKKFRLVSCYAFDTTLVNPQELQIFLGRHWNSLREIELVDVLLSTVNPVEDVCRNIESLLNRANANLPQLVSFKMCIHRRHRRDEHDYEICGGQKESSECVADCENYSLYFGSWLHRKDLEKLADTLQVDLKEDTWDFGQYVMRKLAQGKEERDQDPGMASTPACDLLPP